ncbi:acetyl/propionyl/methylcrotonyl-CoA carboxylase subunit alpha [Modestobacter sp. VKM Ac-2979]|uniref:acetyl-CoA carboxylase biotin carboxylase subunit n=1 Tax=unclassified Modestobacter TaxID=2643866 RepID=UPI0022AB9302|nr:MULTISPECIES: acetyl/propionyl/methylcrotonyl-CoA carboxylase subunit alpha [unclassified Modestobacter]MCZ2809950.1 acetyl/propionyl/methylcrotonyl-CoA carboxylase subunit alpha [Modestobacter sp. VKM Ac-2979]MCZ2842635.1 acetyl/propionyl/methylcrotonyl-CoA carboxylase subunit alpha [Modestobacter sp. VKM Ac-2980]
MFETVLVANRGEIAVRVIRTLRAMGIRSVAVYSEADTGALHTRLADVAVPIGPAPAALSYLSIERVLDAARRTGAQAVHPGYGFLSENVEFARACEKAGIVFIGPPVAAIEAMGDKIRAKQTVAAAGVPVVPGRTEPGMDDAAVARAAVEVGFPVLLKPSAGGGGKGMRVVRDPAELAEQIAGARREARSSFGDDTLLVERYLGHSRHIEVQVFGDEHGTVVHLGERECSLQRRHQKVIEEAPSPLLSPAQRQAMGAAAVEAARAVGYTGAGTVEFIVDADSPQDFFFLEMNTRLQVEHPVTECVTGLDLVELQLRVAAGERLPIGQDDVRLTGHAIEARVYAEDPARGFLPQAGAVVGLVEPTGAGVRVDSSLRVGGVIGTDYDPMLAKVIAWGPDRETARARLVTALGDTAVLGVATNTGFLRDLLTDPDVVAGRLDTGLIERRGEALTGARPIPPHVHAAAALALLAEVEPRGAAVDPWADTSGWRLGEPAWTVRRLQAPGADPVTVRVRGRSTAAQVRVGDGEPMTARVDRDGDLLGVTLDDVTTRYTVVHAGGTVWLAGDGHAVGLREHERLATAGTAAGSDGAVTAPMPGTVTVVQVSLGDQVEAGTPLLVVEAMKMEHVLTAPLAGTVTELPVTAGQSVRLDERVAVVTPPAPGEEE